MLGILYIPTWEENSWQTKDVVECILKHAWMLLMKPLKKASVVESIKIQRPSKNELEGTFQILQWLLKGYVGAVGVFYIQQKDD